MQALPVDQSVLARLVYVYADDNNSVHRSMNDASL